MQTVLQNRSRRIVRQAKFIFVASFLFLAALIIFSTDPGLARSNNLQPRVSMAFSTYLGTEWPGGPAYQTLREAAFDSAGNIVVVGTGIFDPAGYPGVPVTTIGVIDDSSIIVAKLLPDGSDLLWVTFIGGTGVDKGAYGVALDADDNIYIAGETAAPDFPTTSNAFDRTPSNISGPNPDAYALKLAADGGSLIYSTYLSGSNGDAARGGLTIDDQGHAYIVGSTDSPDFLENASSGNPANKVNNFIGGVGDGFIVKLSIDGSEVEFMRHLGSPSETNHSDTILGVILDDQGNIYTTAFVRGLDAITTDGSNFRGGASDIYFAKLTPDATQLLYAAYWGGSSEDGPEHALARDADGNIYVSGYTMSTDFYQLNAAQPDIGGGADGFLVKFDSDWNVVFSTYVGASATDTGMGVTVTPFGNIVLTGLTESTDFQTSADAMDRNLGGSRDGFVRIYSANGTMLYSSYYGGSGPDFLRTAVLAGSGNLIALGESQSSNFPTSANAYDRVWNSNWDITVSRFAIDLFANLNNVLSLPIVTHTN